MTDQTSTLELHNISFLGLFPKFKIFKEGKEIGGFCIDQLEWGKGSVMKFNGTIGYCRGYKLFIEQDSTTTEYIHKTFWTTKYVTTETTEYSTKIGSGSVVCNGKEVLSIWKGSRLPWRRKSLLHVYQSHHDFHLVVYLSLLSLEEGYETD